jgi:hypothetical protein
MIYFKSVLVGLGTALLGCVVTPTVMMVWVFWSASKAAPPGLTGPGEQQTVSFSLLGFINHFWWFLPFIVVLFCAGFLLSYWRTRKGDQN